ncbi:MAG: MoxR family ATPase [Acetobacteraceae bacterium]|nr:MoxR family ATPase [Acetobacteraceae bacterium]
MSLTWTQRLKAAADRIRDSVGRVVVGKEQAVELAMVALLCEGHVLIEDVPGIGKTVLAKSLARSLGASFRRIQCTPDLLPSDVTGVSYFNQKTGEFEFRPGPVMAQVVLVDEINRATPRTQSSLLECMQERQVTVDGVTHPLPRPFLVLATQNPVELEGTFPLPEAQLDRFMMRVRLGYPDEAEEIGILRRFRDQDPLADLEPVLAADELLELTALCRQVTVSQAVESYVVAIARASRSHPDVELGLSPRGSLALYHGSQALAAIRGRNYVKPDDVKALAVPVIAHRLMVRLESGLKGRTADEIAAELVAGVEVPVEEGA